MLQFKCVSSLNVFVTNKIDTTLILLLGLEELVFVIELE